MSLGRVPWVVLGSALLVGCGGASWLKVEMPEDYEPPKEAKVAVIARVDQADVADAVAEGVLEELDDRGIRAARVPSNSPDADISVNIRRWDEGSQALRYFIGFGAGEAKIVASVSSSLGVDGLAEGWLRGGWFGGESVDAGRELGELVGFTFARSAASRSMSGVGAPNGYGH